VGSLEIKKFNQKIRSLREAAKLTQQGLAARAGISLSTLTKLEEGTTKAPSATVLFKLAQALNFDIDEVLDDSRSPQPQPLKTSFKFIYFDVGGVLVHTESAFLQPLSVRLNRPLDAVRQVYHTYIRVACHGKISLEDMQVLMMLKLGVRFIGKNKHYLFKHWVDDMSPILETHRFAAELASRYPLGLLTDTVDGWVEQMLAKDLLPPLNFKAIIKSSDVGFVKPEAAIFELATKQAGVRPEEILFIDDRRINVKGARAYGWQAEWFNELKPQASIARIKRKYF